MTGRKTEIRWLEFIGKRRHFKGRLKKNTVISRNSLSLPCFRSTHFLAVFLVLISASIPRLSAESATGQDSPPPSFSVQSEISVSPYALISDSEYLPPLLHSGLSGKAGLEAWLHGSWALRIEAAGFMVNPSAITTSGELYRGWEGYSAGLLAGGGYGLGKARLSMLAGAGLTAARYKGTALVFAYPSIKARLGLDLFHESGIYLSFAIPAELLLRGGTVGYSLGAEVGIGFRTGARRMGR